MILSQRKGPPMSKSRSKFEQLDPRQSHSIARDVWEFIVENKNWWMIPIALVLGVFGLFIFFAGTGAAPFIYTLF